MTLTSTPKRKTRRAPSKIRRAHRQALAEKRGVTGQIMAHGQASARLATQAAATNQAKLTPDELQGWISDFQARLEVIQQHPEQNLGHIEEQLARSVKEPLPRAADWSRTDVRPQSEAHRGGMGAPGR